MHIHSMSVALAATLGAALAAFAVPGEAQDAGTAATPATPQAGGQVKVEKVAYYGQPNCYKLSNGVAEVIVTTDIGPRIIRYSFPGEDNILAEMPADQVAMKTELGEWKPYGGHRLWAAPEALPRSYAADNSPVAFKIEGENAIRLTPPLEEKTGLQKEMLVSLAPDGTMVTITHRITNKGLWGIDLAPWALTIMRGGGVTILPQEPYVSHGEPAGLPPARPLVLWHYTDLMDPRFTIGKKYMRMKTDDKLEEPQKIGVMNKQGWAGYCRAKTLFVKRFDYKQGATYPDYGCNTETYTAGSFMEVETLGSMSHLEPGETAEHVERWFLFRNVDIGDTEATLDAALTPVLAQTR